MIQIGIEPITTAAIPDGTHFWITQTKPFALINRTPLAAEIRISFLESVASFSMRETMAIQTLAMINLKAVRDHGGIVSIA